MKPIIASAKDPAATVRFPADLLKQLNRTARVNGRSRNSEIIVRLRESLEHARGSANAA